MKIFTFILLFFMTKAAMAGLGHKPPGPPESGFGSGEEYITDHWTLLEAGSTSAGDKTWTYIPDQLQQEERAPVVVFLHGFAALNPTLYQTHIEHLVRQGNIVIFPLFQKSSFWGFLSESGLFSPMDQSIWARRAVDSVALALDAIADIADTESIYLYGHSLGGLIALAWQAEGGVPVQHIVLSHAQVDASAGMPDFVKQLVKVIEIPWRDYAPAIEVPVLILNGEEDNIAPPSQSEEIFHALIGAPEAAYYLALSDRYGYPDISPNHGAPMDVIQGLPPHLKIFAISGELDALDYRFYFAALDAVIAGWPGEIPFSMGQWSDGTPVNGIENRLIAE